MKKIAENNEENKEAGTPDIMIGRYRHFKGGEYEVLGFGKHSETEEKTVIYRSLKTGEIWLRPATMWLETVDREDYCGPRFIRLEDSSAKSCTTPVFTAKQRREAAISYFMSGYNCSQAVVAAYKDKLTIPFDEAMRLACSFGGGMGRLREVCGAVSGMFLIIGLVKGYSEPDHPEKKKAHYALVQELAEKFKERHGSIVCRTLLGLNISGADSPIPEERTPEYYTKRPCPEIIGDAAEILSAYIDGEPCGDVQTAQTD